MIAKDWMVETTCTLPHHPLIHFPVSLRKVAKAQGHRETDGKYKMFTQAIIYNYFDSGL